MTNRVRVAVAVLLASAGCGGGSARLADPVTGIPPAHQREISRSDFPDAWPFVTGTGTLACENGAIAFRAQAVTYALNDAARTRGYADAAPIVVTQSAGPSHPLGRLRQDDRMHIFAESEACASRAEPAACRRDLAGAHQLTPDELNQIDVEGHERFWPPLSAPKRSLQPVIAAGLALCSR